jgi:anti-sigma-K factor RskA
LNVQEFISSGILESYVLGTASGEEIRMVRGMEMQYPEVKAEIEEIEASLVAYAEAETNSPSAGLKSRITNMIFEDKKPSRPQGSVVNIRSLDGSSRWMKYAIAASLGLLIGLSAFTFSLYKSLEKAKYALNEVRAENEVLETELGEQMETMMAQSKALSEKELELALVAKPGSKMVMLKGLDLAPDASAMIVWNKNDKQVYLNSVKLPPPPEGRQYQLWAIVNGKPVDAGVFVVTGGTFRIQQMKDIQDAQAFAITLEKEGGSPSPTMNLMYLMGDV